MWRATVVQYLHSARSTKEGILLHSQNTVFDTSVPNRLLISLPSSNPGPRRGRPGAIKEHIAGKLDTITVQEAIEYLQHECLMNHFYITHFAGCAVLFNNETLHSDVRVMSVYTHDTRTAEQQVVKEVKSCWVLQAVISHASFRRIPRNGKSYFTMMLLHVNNQYAKKRGLAKNFLLAVRTVMYQEQVDMVAGDFNGAAWRRRSGNEQLHDSTIEEAFANTNLPIPHVPYQLCGEASRSTGPMCAVSSRHLAPKLSGTFAWTVRSKSLTKLLESNIPTRVATTKCGFISYMSTHGWLIAHLEIGNIGGHS